MRNSRLRRLKTQGAIAVASSHSPSTFSSRPDQPTSIGHLIVLAVIVEWCRHRRCVTLPETYNKQAQTTAGRPTAPGVAGDDKNN